MSKASARLKFRTQLDQVDPVHRTKESALIAGARLVTRLEAKRRLLRQQLRGLDVGIRAAKRDLRALLAAPGPDTPIPASDPAPATRGRR